MVLPLETLIFAVYIPALLAEKLVTAAEALVELNVPVGPVQA